MNQTDVIAFLSNPRSYGPEVTSVDTHETHGAIVFLAGRRAYKLKRSVKYRYMDYSTTDQRRAMCQAELAINRRTAANLYLEVRPIVRGPNGHLQFGSDKETEAVDWVVVMRRFEQSALLDELRKRNALTPTLMHQLAEKIASFHRASEIRPDCGGSQAILNVIEENVAILRNFLGRPLSALKIDQYRDESLKVHGRLSALLEMRRKSGHVRRCHGDLHLSNICMIDGEPVLFDAIEFDEQFSCIDVFYDLSFLIMDLEHRRLRSLANVLLNRYLEVTQDTNGIGALRLFLSCRAAIRSHVEVALAEKSAGDIQPVLDDAVRLLDDAIAFLEPAEPWLVAIGGLSGTGKSTVARGLAPFLGSAPGAIILRSDTIRKRLFGVAETVHLPESAYTPEVSARVYKFIADRAEEILRAGHSVVADAVYGSADEREAIALAAGNAGAKFAGVWLEAPFEELAQRISRRQGDASDATPDVLRNQRNYVRTPDNWNRVDCSAGFGLCFAEQTARVHLTGQPDPS